MPSIWRLGGLTPLKLAQLGFRKISEDELSNRSAALSYYFLLALFPMLLFLVSLLAAFAGPDSHLRENIVSTLGRLAPGTASDLIRTVVNQTFTHSSGIKLAAGILGALWAASGGMDGVVTSLNLIHRTKETRPWWKQKLLIVGLTLALGILILSALLLALYGEKIGHLLASQIGLGGLFNVAWNILHWLIAFAAMFFSYSLIYYFGPDLEMRKWYWITPGAVAGVALWLIASFGLRIYLHFFNSYSATYGSLGAVVILMLWLYLTGFAILMGAEVNWIIENAESKRSVSEVRTQVSTRPAKTA